MAGAVFRQSHVIRAGGAGAFLNPPVFELPQDPLPGSIIVVGATALDPNDGDPEAITSVIQSTESGTKTGFSYARIANAQSAGDVFIRHEVWLGIVPDNNASRFVEVLAPKSSAYNFNIAALEYVNILVPAQDQLVTNEGDGDPITTGATGVTSQADEVAIAFIGSNDGGQTHTPATFTQRVDGPVGFGTIEGKITVHDLILTVTQSVSESLTFGGDTVPFDDWISHLITLRAEATGDIESGGTVEAQSGSNAVPEVTRETSGLSAATSGSSAQPTAQNVVSGIVPGQSGGTASAVVSSINPAIDVELPAIYLDNVFCDEDTGIVILSQNPEPNETQVPISSNVYLEIWNTGASQPDQTATTITVDGVLAWDGASPQNGWGVVVTDLTSPGAGGPDGLSFLLVPPAVFLSLDVIQVDVTSDLVGGGSPFAESYSFTIEDLTPPEAASAIALDKKTVRVIFDEAVRATGDGTAADALTPSNYTFEAIHDSITPAVSLNAVSVEKISDTEYDVTLDVEMSRHLSCEGNELQYRVIINNVEDLFGNAAGPAQAVFDAFQPQAPDRRNFCIYKMFAELNRREDESLDLLRFSNVLQDVVDLILCKIDEWVDILDIDTADEQFLDVILESLGNPFAFDLSENDKRKLARILVDIYKLKGTAPGICAAVEFFLGIAQCLIVEFNDLDGWVLGEDELGEGTFLGLDDSASLYSFDVEVDRTLSDEERRQLREIVDFMKPPHTHHINTVEP